MFNVGLSTCGKGINEALFSAYKNAGIKYMEITCNPDTLNYELTKSLAKKYGITLWSFHLPFVPFSEIDISNPELCEHTVKYFKSIIKKAIPMGVKIFVVHPSGEPIDDGQRKMRLECAKNSLKVLAEFAKENDVIIAVEDLPRTCLGKNSDEILELLSVHEGLRVCFDTNHLLSEDINTFVEHVGNKIITTHVSDYDFIDERHWLPGEGKVDWQELISALKKAGYNGPWIYEIVLKSPKNLNRGRDLIINDFSQNAKQLFEGKKPTLCNL